MGKNDDVTLFTNSTMKPDGSIAYDFNENRPLLLLTSTTYTEDEVAINVNHIENRVSLLRSDRV